MLNRAPTCAQCGSLNCRVVEAYMRGEPTPSAASYLCASCLMVANSQAVEFRRQFEELLEQGVNRVLANEVMCDRVNAYHDAKGKTP